MLGKTVMRPSVEGEANKGGEDGEGTGWGNGESVNEPRGNE